MSTDLATLLPAVAADLFGEPVPGLSSDLELHYGPKGAVVVDLEHGTFRDADSDASGDVLALIAWATGRHANGAPGGAVEWLQEHGYDVAGLEPHNDFEAARWVHDGFASIARVAELADPERKLGAFRVMATEVPSWVRRGGISKTDAVDWLLEIGDTAGLRAEVVENVIAAIFAEAEAKELARLEADHPPAPAALHFEAVWFRDAEATMLDPEWLVDDILTRYDRSLFYGPTGSGKSFFATDIALSIARGVNVFGRDVLPGGVIYVAAEGRKGFKNRLKAYRQHFRVAEKEPLPFVLVPVAIDMFSTGRDADAPKFIDDLARLAEELRQAGFPPELLVFDTHAAVSPGANENASEDVGRLTRHYAQAQQAAGGAHTLIVHHMNAAGERPRGHTSLLAGMDSAVEVENDEAGYRTAVVTKQRDGESGLRLQFRLQVVEVGQRERDGRPITSCVVEPLQKSETAAVKRGPRLSSQERIGLGALRESVLAVGEPAPASLKLPQGVKVVKIEHWQREFIKRAFNEAQGESTVRSALQRVSDGLMSKNVIGRDQPYVWIAREPST